MAEMSNERPQSKSIQRYAESIDLEGCQLPEAQKLTILMQPLDIHEKRKAEQELEKFQAFQFGEHISDSIPVLFYSRRSVFQAYWQPKDARQPCLTEARHVCIQMTYPTKDLGRFSFSNQDPDGDTKSILGTSRWRSASPNVYF